MTSRPLNKGELEGVFRTYPAKGADEILRLGDALRRAGETCEAARKITEETLAIWPAGWSERLLQPKPTEDLTPDDYLCLLDINRIAVRFHLVHLTAFCAPEIVVKCFGNLG